MMKRSKSEKILLSLVVLFLTLNAINLQYHFLPPQTILGVYIVLVIIALLYRYKSSEEEDLVSSAIGAILFFLIVSVAAIIFVVEVFA